MDLIATANSTVSTIAKAVDYVKNNVFGHFNDTSMTTITKLTRAEPLTIISNDCSNLAYLPDLMNTMVSLYSAHYLQAVAIMTRVRDIEVVRLLDRLNPDRDSTGFLLEGRLATESIYEGRLFNNQYSLPTARVMAAESDSSKGGGSGMVDRAALYEASNLAVGKLLNVVIDTTDAEGNERSHNIPVSVRLSPTFVPTDTLNYIFTHRAIDDSWTEKWYAWRAGRISFIKDGIFAQNMIDEYRKAAMQDKSGTLQEIVRRATNARTYGMLTKNPSLAVSSNLYVISKPVSQAIEHKVGVKFADSRGRAKLLNGTYAMIIAVVDEEKEMIDFYFRDIEAPARVSVRSLKSVSKDKNGLDIGDLMRSLMEGKTPTF